MEWIDLHLKFSYLPKTKWPSESAFTFTENRIGSDHLFGIEKFGKTTTHVNHQTKTKIPNKKIMAILRDDLFLIFLHYYRLAKMLDEKKTKRAAQN
jgi:hypothetical protein